MSAPNFQGCANDVARGLPYCDTALTVEQRLDDLMSRLSLADKVAQITPQRGPVDVCTCLTRGKAEIGLPPWLWLVETNTNVASGCPAEGRCATTFVGPLGLGASFNRTVWRLKGSVLGTEMRALSNTGGSRFSPDGRSPIGLTGFGPNINIARDPRFGRNSELPGEDPLLSGTYAYEMVLGMQERDSRGYPKMAAYLKHFSAYSTETNRGHDTYIISTYDLFDTYLPQYALAMHAQPFGVMCSYNAVNGQPSCANTWLLNQVLRPPRGHWPPPYFGWNADTMVSTDCGAVSNLRGPPVNAPDDAHAAAYALMNGTDLEMGDDLFNALPVAIQMGLATEERLDEAVRRTFKVHFKLGRFDPPEATQWSSFGLQDINSTHHQRISYEAALQSLVLLRNNVEVLPLRQGQRIAVLGPQGVARKGLLSSYAADQICFQGGDGCIGTIAEGISEANAGGVTEVRQGVEVNSTKTDGIGSAIACAQSADAIVLVLGNDRSIEYEGHDRTDTALPGLQEAFARLVLAVGKPTVLVLTSGGALAIDSLLGAPYAIVEAFSPAVSGGRALGASLFGLENRWGKLPITMYPHEYIQQQPMTNYDMSRAPGRTYKYYTGKPLFPFGFGLSLTTFSMDCAGSPGGDFDFACAVVNTGGRDGDEVVQVYHRAEAIGEVDHPLPRRALVDFARVSVRAGGVETVHFRLSDEAFKVVNRLGVRVLYPGAHLLIFSRGHGAEQQLPVRIPPPAAASTPRPRAAYV